jgi:spermidine/putrescine transport system permease protein
MILKKRRKKWTKAAAIAFAGLMFLFLYLPILVVIIFSFNTSKLNIEFKGFTFMWYSKMLQNELLMSALKNTLIVAASSTLLTVLIGTVAAVGMYRFSFKGKSIIDSLLYIPIVIPEIVMGISLLAFFTMCRITIGMTTLIIAHVTFSLPFVVITVRSRVAGFEKSIEEAAMDLGATRMRTFLRVTLPLIAPGVMAGAMLALTLSLDDVVVSFYTTGIDSITLPIRIFSMVRTGVSPDVNALCTVIILGTLLIMLLSGMIRNKSQKREES